jgi:hypothetical protein
VSAADFARRSAELERRFASRLAGHNAAARVLFAIDAGGDAEQLTRDAIDAINATRDPERMDAFRKSLAKAVRT